MDRYNPVRELGAGNYGTVSIVRSRVNGAQYCLKRVDWSGRTPEQREEAKNEVVTMAKLSHPNIVSLIESFSTDSHLYIVMEFVEGLDLEKYIQNCGQKRRAMSDEKVMLVFIQIALALRHIHARNLLHRDLKSANVFLTANGDVKLGDFGFAKQLKNTMAVASTVCGTPFYFSPELCAKKRYNAKSDVWSLGVILYEMLNLRKPFPASNFKGLVKMVLNNDPAPMETTVNADLKELCLALLAKDPAQRPWIDDVLRMPIVKSYMKRFHEKLTQLREQCEKRREALLLSNPREPSESAAPLLSANPSASPASRKTYDRNDVRALLSGAKKASDMATVPPAPNEHQLTRRDVPNARQMVSNAAPQEVVDELQGVTVQRDFCTQLENDLQEAIALPPSTPGAVDMNEVIGEAEGDEEEMLRKELGPVFVRAVELVLQMLESPTQSDAYLSELKRLLGPNEHLIEALQRVSAQFELDK